MPDGRGARILLEAGFLVAVAAVLALAQVEPLWIVLVMLVAWIVVAALEWAAWREEPHWASGQPPRYYLPSQPLPPRPPTQELPAFSLYPQPPAPTQLRDDAPTWIATPELRQELLGWPAPEPVEQEPDEPVAAGVEPEENGWEAGWPVVHAPEGEDTDPWTLEQLPEVVESEPAAVEPDPVAVEPAPVPVPPVPVAVAAVSERRLSRHRLDPFAEEAARRRPWQRRAEDIPADAELPSLPHHARIPQGAGR